MLASPSSCSNRVSTFYFAIGLLSASSHRAYDTLQFHSATARYHVNLVLDCSTTLSVIPSIATDNHSRTQNRVLSYPTGRRCCDTFLNIRGPVALP